MHAADLHWLTHGIQGLPIARIRHDVGRDITPPIPKTFDPTTYRPFQGTPTVVLQGGEVINLGGRTLRILHTPGHSPGHISIHDATEGYLFTGDLLYAGTIYAFYPSTSPEDLVASLNIIAQLPHVTRVYGAHHRLGLEAGVLEEVRSAVAFLRAHHLIAHGTGLHRFPTFAIQF